MHSIVITARDIIPHGKDQDQQEDKLHWLLQAFLFLVLPDSDECDETAFL